MTLKRAIRWPIWRIEVEVQAIRGILFWIGAVAKLWFIRRVRLPPATLKFFNPDPPVSPITIILNSESEED